MGANDAGDGALVYDSERRVAQLLRSLNQFLGLARAAQEAVVREAAQLRIGGNDGPELGRHANEPCRYQRTSSPTRRSWKTHKTPQCSLMATQ